MKEHENVYGTASSDIRNMRKIFDTVVPLIGVVIVLGVAFLNQELRDIVYVVLGVTLIEVGLWKLSHKIFPDQRKYHALRTQADQFLRQVRLLNAAVLKVRENDSAANRQAIEEIRQAMFAMVEQMTDVAGKTDADLTTPAPLTRDGRVSSLVS